MKRIHYIFLAAAVIVLAGGGYLMSRAGTNELPGQLEVAEKFYDFGTVGLEPVSHTYAVKNTGVGPLTIRKISTSCGCTTAQLKKTDGTTAVFSMDHGGTVPYIDVSLAPGEEAAVIATYNPLAHGRDKAAGLFNRSVYVMTDNPRQEHELQFRVQVDPAVNTAKPQSVLRPSE